MIKKQISAEASKVFLMAVEPEFYTIPFTQKDIKSLRYYPATAEKIGCMATLNPSNQQWGIELEKKYSFTNTETIFEENKQKANLEVQQLFSTLAKDLIDNAGMNEDDVRQIIINNDENNLLSSYQKAILKKLLEKANVTQNSTLEDITYFISARLEKLWTLEDTAVLPESILKEFKYFIEQERAGWENEETIDLQGEGLGESLETVSEPMLTGTIAA